MRTDNVTQLFLRFMNEPEIRSIPGTEGARHPVFSPDGNFIAFDDQTRLYRVPIAGGLPTVLTDAGTYPSWGSDGVIYFWNDGLWRAPAEAGEPKRIAEVKNSRNGRPKFVADHDAVLFEGLETVEILSLRTGERHVVAEGGASPHYVRSGHVLFSRAGTVFAVPFDPARLRSTGRAVPLSRDVRVEVGGAVQLAVADDGTLFYLGGGSEAGVLVEVDRQGEVRTLGQSRVLLRHPRFSPDGRRVALEIAERDPVSVWVQEVDRNVLTRVTMEGSNVTPIWSPDTASIAFSREGKSIWVRSADATGTPKQLSNIEALAQYPLSWSRDASVIIVSTLRPGTGRDIDVLHLENGKLETLLGSKFNESQGALSPDGRRLAFTSNDSGNFEVFVVPFPDATRRWQISTDGGSEPVWSPDGRQLFYRDADKMLSVAVRNGSDLSPGNPVLLFERRFADGGDLFANYDVRPDGQGFVMIQGDGKSVELQVVLNWSQELELLAPGSR